MIRKQNKGGYPMGQQVTRKHRTDKGHFILENNALVEREFAPPPNPPSSSPSTAPHPPATHSLSLSLSLPLLSAPVLPPLVFFIPSIGVIRIESFNKKFCSPAESAPFCEFKWKSARESGRGWQPGGRRALLACKLKCCHLNANKTPPRAESNVEKEGGVRREEGREKGKSE